MKQRLRKGNRLDPAVPFVRVPTKQHCKEKSCGNYSTSTSNYWRGAPGAFRKKTRVATPQLFTDLRLDFLDRLWYTLDNLLFPRLGMVTAHRGGPSRVSLPSSTGGRRRQLPGGTPPARCEHALTVHQRRGHAHPVLSRAARKHPSPPRFRAGEDPTSITRRAYSSPNSLRQNLPLRPAPLSLSAL